MCTCMFVCLHTQVQAVAGGVAAEAEGRVRTLAPGEEWEVGASRRVGPGWVREWAPLLPVSPELVSGLPN